MLVVLPLLEGVHEMNSQFLLHQFDINVFNGGRELRVLGFVLEATEPRVNGDFVEVA